MYKYIESKCKNVIEYEFHFIDSIVFSGIEVVKHLYHKESITQKHIRDGMKNAISNRVCDVVEFLADKCEYKDGFVELAVMSGCMRTIECLVNHGYPIGDALSEVNMYHKNMVYFLVENWATISDNAIANARNQHCNKLERYPIENRK